MIRKNNGQAKRASARKVEYNSNTISGNGIVKSILLPKPIVGPKEIKKHAIEIITVN
jgi:hypothetical protein